MSKTKSFFSKTSFKKLLHFELIFYLYSYESKYMIDLIRVNKLRGRRFHSTFRFIDGLRALNDGGEFGKAFLQII